MMQFLISLQCHRSFLNSLYFCAVFLGLLLFSSCGQQDATTKEGVSPTDSTEVDSASTNQKLLSDKLTILYLNNTRANAELFRLIGNKEEKVIFQFSVDASGNMGLYGFSGLGVKDEPVTTGSPHGQSRPIRDRGRFFAAQKIKLSDTRAQAETLAGKDAVLGDLQLEQLGVEELRRIMVKPTSTANQPGYEYILFTPVVRLEKDPDNPNVSVTNLNYVYYMISHSSTLPTNLKDTEDTVRFKTFINVSVNPSPPRKTY